MAIDGRSVSRIGDRSIPVVPAVLVAIVAGAVFGTWLGVAGPGAPSGGGGSTSTDGPTATATSVPTPTVTATPIPATPGPSGPDSTGTVLELTGEGDATSESFTVTPGWRIEWTVDGTSIAIALHGDPEVGIILQEAGPAVGVTQPAASGTFTMEITADGPWTVRVVQP